MDMGRRAIVTGGTRGIGAAISVALKEAGHSVAANYAGNDEAAKAFEAETGIKAVKWDVGDYDACVAGVAAAEKALGGPVEILVNNAGITRDGMFHKMSKQSWDDVIRVDLTSLFNMTRPVIDGMREAGWGRVVNISSINGQKGQMGQVNYSAAKAGVIGFTKALAQETARKGVTVNCVAPGYIDTDMVSAVPQNVLDSIIAGIPVGRLGKAEEIGRAVAYLCGDDAGFITGAVLAANGGQYMSG
ncbi:MAG: acetoacetyl-CoA reductase [Maricaulaceae bacterium]|nr:acetoacetyl-CoA reductase [Maricaulaceae bacterium]